MGQKNISSNLLPPPLDRAVPAMDILKSARSRRNSCSWRTIAPCATGRPPYSGLDVATPASEILVVGWSSWLDGSSSSSKNTPDVSSSTSDVGPKAPTIPPPPPPVGSSWSMLVTSVLWRSISSSSILPTAGFELWLLLGAALSISACCPTGSRRIGAALPPPCRPLSAPTASVVSWQKFWKVSALAYKYVKLG